MPAGGEEQAIAFYEGLLAIAHVPKPPHLASRGGCWFEDGDLKVHVGVDTAFHPATKAHPAFVVDDVRGLAGRIASAGHRIVDDELLEGYDRVYADDPVRQPDRAVATAHVSRRPICDNSRLTISDRQRRVDAW